MAGIACLSFVLLLTPDRVAALAALGLVGQGRGGRASRLPGGTDAGAGTARAGLPVGDDPLGLRALELPITITRIVASGVTVIAVVVGALSLVVRFRRAHGTERQQLRWVALAAVLASLAILVVLAGMAVGNAALLIWAAGISFAILPPAIGAAVARYRLYDLDRIISRTLAYGLLTVLLAGGYAAVALVLGQLLGRDSSLVVAAATLAVAAVFQPARRRIQALVDRRFNRRRYDTARTIAAFSSRLREQVDLATLTAELLAVADQTMQPTQASLWLRPQGPPDAAARTVVRRMPAVE